MFLTTSYILTAQQDHCEEIINIFNKRGLKASIIGEIITENVLKISDGKDSIDVLNFA